MQTQRRRSFVFRTSVTASAFMFAATLAATTLFWAPFIVAAELPANLPAPSALAGASNAQADKIDPYIPRFGRSRPVVAIIGENSGTELVDFVIPYGVLTQSGAAEIVTVATRQGVLNMRPALKIQPQATIEQFDARFPDGADYVIVPAVVKSDDPALLTWVAAQGAKGGTVVSICDGALVVANSGLMKGHRATAHWATEDYRKEKYPDTRWVKNIRYVADGKIVSSAGISAAIPTSLALVEAIAGYEKTAALAKELGVAEWSTQHNSDLFPPQFGVNLTAFVVKNFINGLFHSTQRIGVPVAAGVDDIALALTADAYSRTGRSHAYSVSASSEPVQTRHGLMLLPDLVIGGSNPPDQTLPELDAMPSVQMLDKVLAGIAESYGRATARGVALDFEYPGFQK